MNEDGSGTTGMRCYIVVHAVHPSIWEAKLVSSRLPAYIVSLGQPALACYFPNPGPFLQDPTPLSVLLGSLL